MNARILGLVGVVAAVVAGCKSDPTNPLVGKAARVGLQFATVRLTVADSLATFATVIDEASNPVVEAVSVTACDPTTVAVAHVGSGSPLVRTNFYIKGIKYGIACVIATASGFTDTMQVATVPDHIAITTGPDSIKSGDSAVYAFKYVDKVGAIVAGVPAPTWASDSTLLGTFPSASVPTYIAGPGTGVNTVVASFSISVLGGTVTMSTNSTKVVTTTP
jgi:hypothetical protein